MVVFLLPVLRFFESSDGQWRESTACGFQADSNLKHFWHHTGFMRPLISIYEYEPVVKICVIWIQTCGFIIGLRRPSSRRNSGFQRRWYSIFSVTEWSVPQRPDMFFYTKKHDSNREVAFCIHLHLKSLSSLSVWGFKAPAFMSLLSLVVQYFGSSSKLFFAPLFFHKPQAAAYVWLARCSNDVNWFNFSHMAIEKEQRSE